MRRYELTAVFPIEDELHQAGLERLLADLAANSAEIETTGDTVERDLAYEIDKRRRGRYVLFTLKAPPASIASLEKIFRLNTNLVRYLFVRAEE
jgi:small subunit ribosomal protein S6